MALYLLVFAFPGRDVVAQVPIPDERGFINLTRLPAYPEHWCPSGGYRYEIKSGEFILSNSIAEVGRAKILADGSFVLKSSAVNAKGSLSAAKSISVETRREFDCKYSGVFLPGRGR